MRGKNVSDIGEKARTIFLAVIMITSVMAAGVAFTGSTAADAPPDSPTTDPGNLQVSLLNESNGAKVTFGVNTTSKTINKTNATDSDVAVGSVNSDLDNTARAIQFAIDNATTEYSTVRVGSGIYNGSSDILIDSDDLTLEGPNAGIAGDDTRDDKALINRTSTPGSGGSAVNVTAAGVTVDGFQIESAAQNGISVDQPVSNITIQNNRVTSVAGNTFGSNSGDRATGNGIAIGLPRSASEATVTGLEVNDNVITGVTTEDLASSEDRTTANGIQVLTRQHNVEGMNITGNVISNLEPGASGDSGDNRSRGIVINVGNDGSTIGAADGFTIAGNSISGLTGAGGFSDAAGIALFEAGGAAGDGTDRIGPENFTVTGNRFDNLTNNGKNPAPAIFVGGIQTLGDSHSVTGNTINSGSVIRFAGNQPGFDPATADALNASENTFTDTSANLYYTDGTDAADLDAVFNDNDFSQVDVVVGDTAITRPPTSGEVLNVDQVASFNSIQNAVDSAMLGTQLPLVPARSTSR
uniref:Cell surface glycoprotein n=1 Tax=uncultured haloarchaeon TaxID=160804 RepID=A0A0K1YBD3_9EURY|nr:cell surface glycoprotein [uncultured haloarchaeon]